VSRPFNPDLLAATWYSGTTPPEKWPRLAADALESGYDGPALRRLAGLTAATSRDDSEVFKGALKELGNTRIANREHALLFLSRTMAADIVDGRVEPLQGAVVIARYASMLNYPPFLADFYELVEMQFWGEYAPPTETLVLDIFEQARTLLANVPE
jgi:hypothetical protein